MPTTRSPFSSNGLLWVATRLHCREQTFLGLLVSVRGTPDPGCPPPLPALDGMHGKPFSASGRPCPFVLCSALHVFLLALVSLLLGVAFACLSLPVHSTVNLYSKTFLAHYLHIFRYDSDLSCCLFFLLEVYVAPCIYGFLVLHYSVNPFPQIR